MRVLVLGGYWLLGRLLVDGFVNRGFEVTVFNRGQSSVSLIMGVRYICGDRKREEDLISLRAVRTLGCHSRCFG